MRRDQRTKPMDFAGGALPDQRTQKAEGLFERWVQRRNQSQELSLRLSAVSISKYGRQWRGFVSVVAPATAVDCTAADIERFLTLARTETSSRPRLAKLTQFRYLKLIAELLDLACGEGLRPDNPARELLKDRDRPGEPLPARLAPWEADRLRASLAVPPQDGPWQDLRDWAIVNLVLATGLKLAEVHMLRLASIRWTDGPKLGHAIVRVPSHGTTAARDVPASKQASGALARWWVKRYLPPFEGDALFPGEDLCSALSTAQIYRAVSGFLADLSVAGGTSRGPQVLRNTFALERLAAGDDLARVQELLGYRDEQQLGRLMVTAKAWASGADRHD